VPTDQNAEARAVAAKGRPITLADGTDVVIRVDLENLMLVEERFGSIDGFQAKLTGLAAEDRATRPIFGPLMDALAVLMPWQHPDLRDPRTLARRLDPGRLGDYLTAAMGSLADAVSTGTPPADGRPNVLAIPPTDSLGEGSTTPAPLPWAAATPSSGG
jgi:hypothetical protein